MAIAACLAVAASAVTLVLPGEREARLGTPEASAAATLRLAAESQQGDLTRPLRQGEFFYVRTRNAYGPPDPTLRESWLAVDGTRRLVDGRQGGRAFVWGPPKKGPFYIGGEPLSYDELLALPRDAERLHARLRRAAVDCGCGHSVDHETFTIVGNLIRENPIPADLEAALLRSAALIPGIELVEDEHDVAGRAGVGVAVDYRGYQSVLVFDSETYQLLGENERFRGTLRGGSAVLETGVVSSPTAVP